MTRLRHVARIELGSASYAVRSLLDNDPAVGIGIFQAPGSNSLQVSATAIRAEMEAIKKRFPEDVDYTDSSMTRPVSCGSRSRRSSIRSSRRSPLS